MFYLELNEGGMNGFDKNCPNGVNEFPTVREAAEFASTHIGRVLNWIPGNGENEIISLQIAANNRPVVRILEVGYNYATAVQKRMLKYW
jgi:hypothetical protein